jgi:hypothetical protein
VRKSKSSENRIMDLKAAEAGVLVADFLRQQGASKAAGIAQALRSVLSAISTSVLN